MENQKKSITEIVETDAWRKYTKKLELYSSLIFIVGFLFFLFKLDNSKNSNLLSIGLFAMIINYFFIGFNILKTDTKTLSYWFFKIHGWSLSLAYLSIYIALNDFPFPVFLLFLTAVLGVLSSFIWGIRIKMECTESPQINWLYFLRLSVSSALLIYT